MRISQKLLNEAEPIIKRLAKSRSANGAFAYYERDDVFQEVWCMCLEALGRYDSEIGPVENYLVRHVTNRLKNLKRDKYFRPGSDPPTSGLARTRMNLVNALPLDGGDIAEQGVLLCSGKISVEPIEHSVCNETLLCIIRKLPEELRGPFEELICNNKVSIQLVDEIRQKVAEILSERESDVER